MELPAKVVVYSQIMSLTKTPATLVAVRHDGCYELRLQTPEGKTHTVLLPIAQTAVVMAEPEPEFASEAIER